MDGPIYRPGLPPVPSRMKRLPVDHRGYPVPWFVARTGAEWDFRVADGRKAVLARKFGFCWVCGEKVGQYKTFVIGPMCAVNRTTAEPPCHAECAEFSALACPFLTLPQAKRNEKNLPEKSRAPAGQMIKRNPGVTCLWTTLSYHLLVLEDGGVLYRLSAPTRVEWYAEKQPATREQVLTAIDSGMPLLRAEAERDGPRAVDDLLAAYQRAAELLPAVRA
jgi:hypothetical protein